MATITEQANIISGTPFVHNDGTSLRISIPVSNIGGQPGVGVFLTDITLGAVKRLSPETMPVFIGDINPRETANAHARFGASGLAVGRKYLLTLRGVHGRKIQTGFSISRYITIPPVQRYPIELLKARIIVDLKPATWRYTLQNQEAAKSNRFIVAFSIDIAAPVTNVVSPPGWKHETDGSTYVGWIVADDTPPFAGHIAPGSSLAGFGFSSPSARSESTPYVLTSWNYATNAADVVGVDMVLTPGRVI